MTLAPPKSILAALLLGALALTIALFSTSSPTGAQGLNDGESVQLHQGGNLVSYLGPTSPVEVALNDALIYVDVVWSFQAPVQEWALWSPVLPSAVQGISELVQNDAYFIFVSQALTWTFPFPLPQSCAEQADLRAQQAGSFPVFFLIEPVEFAGNAPAVCSVDRDLPGVDLIAESVQAMLAGPSPPEAAIGVASRWADVLFDPSNCDGADFQIEISGGLATIQFCRGVILTGVVADAIMQTQLNATLTAWADIDRVAILNQAGDCLFDLSGLNLCLAGDTTECQGQASDPLDCPFHDLEE
jgi:hypothetical protein